MHIQDFSFVPGTHSNVSFRSYSRSDPGRFRSYSLSVRSFRPGSFPPDFRVVSAKFGRSFWPTLIYIYFYFVLKVFLANLNRFYAVLIGDKSFSGFPDLFHAVFIDNKS